jgi:hypothetical protein
MLFKGLTGETLLETTKTHKKLVRNLERERERERGYLKISLEDRQCF